MLRGQFGKPADERKLEARAYVKANRQDWQALGFRAMTALIHDEDREYLLADIDHMKADRLTRAAESRATDHQTMMILARRNITTMPADGELDEIKEKAKLSEHGDLIDQHVTNCELYMAKFKALESSKAAAGGEGARMRAVAKAVAYSAMAAAYYRLAVVIYNQSPVKADLKVFDAEADPTS